VRAVTSCHAVRPGRLTPLAHAEDCPTSARPAKHLDRDERLFFRHPDLVELDMVVAFGHVSTFRGHDPGKCSHARQRT
jgi:hypothetical protein